MSDPNTRPSEEEARAIPSLEIRRFEEFREAMAFDLPEGYEGLEGVIRFCRDARI
jgi:hypothetical protein